MLNNGFCTPYFELQRGVRQGDPLSPYLFIIAAEILAMAIHNRSDIRGIKIGQDDFKLVQYADDLTVFVPDIESAKCVFELLDLFETCSGQGSTFPKLRLQYSPKIMHAQELIFESGSRQLLVASCSSLCHNPTSRKNFFAVTSQKEGDIQNSQQDKIFQGNARSNLGSYTYHTRM